MNSLMQQALTAHQANRLDEAEKFYRATLQAEPQNADAMSLLGLVLGTKEKHDEALALGQQAAALDPTSALFAFHLGTILTNAQKLPEGIAAFRRAIELKGDIPEAHYNMANALRANDEWPEAIEAYQQAIKLQPRYAEAYNNLALSLVHEKMFDEALAASKQAVAIEPRYGEGWRTLCNVAEQAKDYNLAVAAGEQCVRLMPDSHFSWFGYGVALCRVNRYAEAVSAYQQALKLKPERADIWDNLGQTYQSLNRLEEAEAIFHKTLEVAGQVIADEDNREVDESEYGNRHWHLSLMELLRGKYKKGFARYRARFGSVGGLKRPGFKQPLWRGENLNGKTILINDEQGFGDTLMMCRYLPQMKAQGSLIRFSMHPALKPLLDHAPYIDDIIGHHVPAGVFDTYASVFDLPYRFGTTLETIPQNVPYLPLLEPTEETRLPNDGRKRVGVVWGGSPLHSNDAKRSVPLPLFACIFANKNVQFFNLNRDLKPGDAELLPQYNVIDLVPKLEDFAVAARFIQQLDLVITCDTATAHLAGGMGKPVWILLPFAPDWRWLTDREDSPWYPTARLFRQKTIGDWAEVMRRVTRALDI
jgi:tetratricopeptide (TPR) repeat protein